MAILTLAELRDAVKKRADMSNSNFIDDTEWNRYINSSIAELRDLLISAYGEDYFALEDDLLFANNTDSQTLPDDFYKMLGVDYVISSEDKVALKRFNFHERNYNRNSNSYRRNHYFNYRYRIQGNTLILDRKAQGAITLHIFYIPTATYLSADLDEFDGYNGWEEYVIVRAAIMGLVKEETDATDLNSELTRLTNRIEAIAPNRDTGEVDTITDSSRDYRSSQMDDLWP